MRITSDMRQTCVGGVIGFVSSRENTVTVVLYVVSQGLTHERHVSSSDWMTDVITSFDLFKVWKDKKYCTAQSI